MTALNFCAVVTVDGFPMVEFQLTKNTGGFHRGVIAPAMNAALYCDAVNAHLASMDCAPMNAGDKGIIVDMANAAHTPTVVAAYQSRPL